LMHQKKLMGSVTNENQLSPTLFFIFLLASIKGMYSAIA